MKVVILTDGPYGDRTYKTIRKYFDAYFIKMEAPEDIFFDGNIEIPKEQSDKIEK